MLVAVLCTPYFVSVARGSLVGTLMHLPHFPAGFTNVVQCHVDSERRCYILVPSALIHLELPTYLIITSLRSHYYTSIIAPPIMENHCKIIDAPFRPLFPCVCSLLLLNLCLAVNSLHGILNRQ